MPSITWWNRLEPRPRSEDVGEALSARIRDPAWMLTRQWQLGEFRGEDAASPAFAQLTTQASPLVAWRPIGDASAPLAGDRPLEAIVETEGFTPSLALRIELGWLARDLLAEAAGEPVAAAFQAAWAVELPSESALAAMRDVEEVRLLRVCGGRALDGVALYDALRASLPALPPSPAVTDADAGPVTQALTRFRDWVAEVYGTVGPSDPAAWRPERLAYGVELLARVPGGGGAAFQAHPGRDGSLDWFALDERIAADGPALPPSPPPRTASIVPQHVRFRGMPNHRFWDFESAQTDFGALTLDTRDVAKLVVADFMLVQGNDWFVIPLDQPAGTLCRVVALLVHDVFGGVTVVERADREAAAGGSRWTLFSTANADDPARLGEYFVLPSSAGPSLIAGEPVEEVRFIRDPMANMAWAVEHATENAAGEPWPGHERDVAGRAAAPPPTPGNAGESTGPRLRYVVQSIVPENWFPLLPVATPPLAGEIAFEVGAMVRVAGGHHEEIPPASRLLAPGGSPSQRYRICEEEVPRGGTRVARVVCRSRWIDGSTHLWVARRRLPGAGEGASGLRFDLVER